jgi:hypothetical protein
MIELRRAGGMRPPRFAETLDIRDYGTFAMWSSVSIASGPPTPIGKFGGELAAAAREKVAAASAAAIADGSRTWKVLPDSPVDMVSVDGVSATAGIRDPVEGAWGELLAVVRPLLGELTQSAIAALALAVDDATSLVHLGRDPLGVDLTNLGLRAVHWRGDEAVGRWSEQVNLGEAVAAAGWRLALPFEHGFDVRSGDRITVYATFAVDRDGHPEHVSLQTT